MIIRRKHTANFTTIGNALFNDERLQADEIGIIGYLLSRPPDWEVRRPALARRFGYGREAIKRVMWSGLRFGWIVAQKTQLSNGRFFTVYEVRDLPGPELSDDQIRAALSLGSSDAGETESEGEGAPGPEPGGATNQPPTGDPATGHPGVGQPATANPYVASKEEATKDGFNKNETHQSARAFSEVQAAWPADHIASAFACERLHAELTDEMRDFAFNGVKPYLEDCRIQSRKVCDLATYYRERRWERFQKIKPQPGAPNPTIVRPHTPQWHRWREYRVATNQSVKLMDDFYRQGREMTMPSEWPPAMPKSESAA